MQQNKTLYRDACIAEKSIPIFNQAWWLDATAGAENWDVAIVEKGGKVMAALPYMIKKHRGSTLLSQPSLTQFLGPWLRESSAKYAKALGQQKDLMESLIDQLPRFHQYAQNWHYSQQNWLPFFWRGFKQTTRYTYVLPELGNEDALWQEVQANIRTDVRKASERFQVRVRDDLGIADFLALNRLVFARQGMPLPYSESFVERLDKACVEHGARKIFIAEDEQGRRHAGVYLIWDANSAYYLMGGSDPELRNSGATSLCMWEAIKFASTVTRRFDFEGSMLEPVERFFRAFGAVQTPYFAVSKTPSRILRTVQFIKELRAGQ
ncbi:GNAT family N-acetyltransferase [Pseudomonas sp. MSSRFD41]|nr:GNAT family N-acetyltransferase [Pseudomonas sp. MSSRFD41]